MENPAEEIKDLVRGLVCRPTLKQQEEVLRRYMTPDAKLYHIDLNQDGLEGIIAIYNLSELLLQYQDVEFHHILYDEQQNAVSVHLTLCTRPVSKLFAPATLEQCVLAELEDVRDRQGNTRKYVKVHRVFTLRDPIVQFLPVIGDIYANQSLRFALGRLVVQTFFTIRFVYRTFVPFTVRQVVWELWIKGPHGPPGECGAPTDGMRNQYGTWMHAAELGSKLLLQKSE